MFDFLKDLLLHSSFIIFLAFTYSFLFIQRREFHQKPIFIGLIFITLIMTMIFPVKFTNGLIFDMKLIPFFISFYYLGFLASISTVLFMIIFQYFFGADSIIALLTNYSIMFFVLYLLKRFYYNGSLLKKIMCGLLVYVLITVTRFGAFISNNQEDQFPYLIVFTLVSFLALAAAIYIIEMSNFYVSTVHELYKAEKMSAISQLAASVAHEIRNPMTTIKGFMQVLKEENNLTTEQQSFLTISLEELERTQLIINNFLSLAKPNTTQNINIDLSQQLNEIVEFMRPYSNFSNIVIHLNVEEGLFTLGNPHELRQVFINIVKNGIEAMNEGGKMEIIATRSLQHIKLCFSDEGIGMSQKQLNRLGQPYYSTKEKGTGLGLMISYDIVRRMKGDIQVKSKVEIGTTFTITLPYHKK